jgi:hypothetical protein
MKNFSLGFARVHIPENAPIFYKRDWSFDTTSALYSRIANPCTLPTLCLRWRVARDSHGRFDFMQKNKATANGQSASNGGSAITTETLQKAANQSAAKLNGNGKTKANGKTTKAKSQKKVSAKAKNWRKAAAIKAWVTIRANRAKAAKASKKGTKATASK